MSEDTMRSTEGRPHSGAHVNKARFRALAAALNRPIRTKKQALAFRRELMAIGYVVHLQEVKAWYGDYSEAPWNAREGH